jgi:hypothetical protein
MSRTVDSTLALSQLTPYQFVVAGESPYVRTLVVEHVFKNTQISLKGYLFDRRKVGRLQEEWFPMMT